MEKQLQDIKMPKYKIKKAWIIKYTVFPKSKYANSGMEKLVYAQSIHSALNTQKKLEKTNIIRVDGIERK